MRKILEGLVFFIGWLLSPFTWWNDAFINMPLSFLLANLLFYITHLPFAWLVIGSYWFTNFLGIFFMYFSGKYLILSSQDKMKATVFLVIFLLAYSTIMLYLDKQGKLIPFGHFFQRYCVINK
jgi:hypothetical protein